MCPNEGMYRDVRAQHGAEGRAGVNGQAPSASVREAACPNPCAQRCVGVGVRTSSSASRWSESTSEAGVLYQQTTGGGHSPPSARRGKPAARRRRGARRACSGSCAYVTRDTRRAAALGLRIAALGATCPRTTRGPCDARNGGSATTPTTPTQHSAHATGAHTGERHRHPHGGHTRLAPRAPRGPHGRRRTSRSEGGGDGRGQGGGGGVGRRHRTRTAAAGATARNICSGAEGPARGAVGARQHRRREADHARVHLGCHGYEAEGGHTSAHATTATTTHTTTATTSSEIPTMAEQEG